MRTNDRPILDLMKALHTGILQLPDFQRGWIWEDHRIRVLLASVTCGYPIGAAMFLETSDTGLQISCRPVEGTPSECGKTAPSELILDGQQRLTSLYAALYSKHPVPTKNEQGKPVSRFYYLDVGKALDPAAEREDAIVSVPENRILTTDFGRRETLNLTTAEMEYEAWMFPLNIILDFSAVQAWQNGLYAYRNYDPDTIRRFTALMTGVILPVMKAELPVILLERDTPREAVCRVFENVNTGGVPLTVFELNTAVYAMDHFRLRRDWEDRREKKLNSPLLEDLDPVSFLMACTLYTTYRKGVAVTCRKKDVLALALTDYKACCDGVTEGFQEAVKLLEEERIFQGRDLPYTAQLIPLGVLCALLNGEGALRRLNCRDKLRRWYWCGVFGEMYGSATETRYVNDVTEVTSWILKDGPEPRTVREATFSRERLQSLQNRQSAAYRGLIALILKNRARDLISGREMDFTFFLSENVDMHHIFPKGWCVRQRIDKQRWNSIVNRTPISYATNRAIGGAAPSQYLDRIEFRQIVSAKVMDECLASHWIRPETVRKDDFDAFYEYRLNCLAQAAAEAMGKPVP